MTEDNSRCCIEQGPRFSKSKEQEVIQRIDASTMVVVTKIKNAGRTEGKSG